MGLFKKKSTYRYHLCLFFLLTVLLISAFITIIALSQETSIKNIFVLCFLFGSLTIAFILYRSAQQLFGHYENIIDILRSYPEPISIKDNQGRVTYLNQAMASLYDLKIDKMLGKKEPQFPVNETLATEKDGVQQRLVKNDQHYLLSNLQCTTHKGNNVTFFTAKNVTELSKAKERSQHIQNKLQCVLDVSEEGLWEYNLVTSECHFDPQCAKIMGWNNGNYNFSDYENSILAEDRAEVNLRITELIEKERPFNIEYRIKKSDGQICWVWDRARVAQRNQDNQPVSLIGIIQDITQDKLNQDKIHSLAFYDPLTSLPNRILLSQHLEQAIKSSIEHNSYSALLLLDLDRFKVLNDSYGHQMGDQLLIEIAKKLQSLVLPKDIIARFGGDEFVFIINQLGSDINSASLKAKQVAKRIKELLTLPIELKLKQSESVPISYFTTVSIGGVLFKTDSHDMDTLLKLSDVALHKVKARGGNDYMIVDPELQNQLNLTADMYKALSGAIDADELRLFYQPQYNADQKIIGAEALLRWNSSKFGMVPPSKFIPLAEESNLIIELGYWVLTQACQQLELWQKDPLLSELQLSINLSAQQIWQEDFVFLAKNIIHHYDFSPSKLTFEITESILIRDFGETIKKLNSLKELGSLISLDDFGTGYSSLSYLKSFPIDEIKIDRSFIQYINSEHSDLLMVKSIIKLSETFELNVVSEGVEDQHQFDKLIELGCQHFQGFYLNRPLPIHNFIEAIEQEHTAKTPQK